MKKLFTLFLLVLSALSIKAQNSFAENKNLAEQGNKAAQYNLGVCYELGLGVTKDYTQAAYWYKKSAEQGHSSAQNNIGACYKNGIGVTKDYAQAVYWFSKSANQGEAVAEYNLGVCYERGQGVAKDYAQAVYWYKKSAEQGYSSAQNNIGGCYKNGIGVTKDYAQAVYWFRKAAEHGDALAQRNLGDCYYYGTGVTKDYTRAVYWFRKSAEQGDAVALYYLGYSYEFGKGVEQNTTLARQWYEKAVAQGDPDAEEALERLNSPDDDSYYDILASLFLGEFASEIVSAVDEKTTPKENLTFTVNGVSFEMVYVEANGKINVNYSGKPMTFALSDYYIGKYEVTQELWKAIMGRSIRQQRDKQGSSYPLFGEGVHYPIYYVSWAECQVFINKLNDILSSELGGKKFALPNLGQWEYAARGGKKSANYTYPGSNNLNDVAWCKENSCRTSHPVGLKKSNELGIFDMFGNVEEYCQKIEGTWPCTFFGGSYERSNYTYGCSGCTTPDSRSAETGLRLVLIP